MTDNTKNDEIIGKIYAQCHQDSAFKARFLSEPKAVLAEAGLPLPDSLKVNVVEDTEPNVLTLHLPPKPAEGLSDQDLNAVSGGTSEATEIPENSDPMSARDSRMDNPL